VFKKPNIVQGFHESNGTIEGFVPLYIRLGKLGIHPNELSGGCSGARIRVSHFTFEPRQFVRSANGDIFPVIQNGGITIVHLEVSKDGWCRRKDGQERFANGMGFIFV